uniref:Uncharacterized protein n=1 Tax=Anopheles quadriannulatus TaxID=34691 RepID=A0A182XQ80_ANOQN
KKTVRVPSSSFRSALFFCAIQFRHFARCKKGRSASVGECGCCEFPVIHSNINKNVNDM